MPGEPFEISPTVPFVPTEEAKAEKPFEISPTVPFVPTEEAKGEKPFEISPTVPFVPIEEAKGEMLNGLETLTNGVMQQQQQQQQGHAERVTSEMEEERHNLKARDARLESSAPATARPNLERSKASDALGLLNGDVSDENVDANQMAEPEEASSQRDEKRRRMEREWLRHKRQSLLQQEELTRRRKVRRSVAQGTDNLRVAGVEVDDDSSLLGGFAKPVPRRPRILLGR